MSSRIALGFAPQVFHAEQSLLLEPCIGHGLLRHRGPGHAPVTQAAHAMLDRGLERHTQTQHMSNLGARPAPLFPVAHPHAPPDPLVQFGDWPVILADAEVAEPAPQVLGEFLQSVVHRYRSRPTCSTCRASRSRSCSKCSARASQTPQPHHNGSHPGGGSIQ